MRKRYVDYLKGIAIILVVLGHINSYNGFVKAWIYSFHMPLFFVATGITTKSRTQISGNVLSNYFCKKVKTIPVPYFLWGLIYAGEEIPRNLLSLIYGSYSRICNIGSLSSLWFLPTMFVAVCAMEIVKILDHKFRLGRCGYFLMMSLCVIVSLAMTKAHSEYPFSLNVAVMALAYIIFGYLLEQIANPLLEKWNKKQMVLLAAISFLGTLTYQWNPIAQDGYVLMANMRLGEPVAFVVTSLMGCLMVYTVARLLDDTGRPNAVLSFFGQNSLVIFAVHKPLIKIFTKLFGAFSLPDGIELLIIGTATLLVSSFLCVLFNRFAPDLAGKPSQVGA